jgi:hypothetical protein
MIFVIIFIVHFSFALIIFIKKFKSDGLSTAGINLVLIVILFGVGWTVTGFISKLLMDQEGFGTEFNRDAFSLSLLTLIEIVFYSYYYKPTATEGDKEK